MIDDATRDRILKRTALLGIVSNAAIAAAKVLIGLVSGSVAIMSDAANNASDMLSSLVTIMGFTLAKRKPTHTHPLGFGRIEYISALFVAFIVLFTGGAFLTGFGFTGSGATVLGASCGGLGRSTTGGGTGIVTSDSGLNSLRMASG